MINYNSPASLRQLLDAEGFSMSKRFGQNFLVDPKARGRIVESLQTEPEHLVWEIGPGFGALTALLLEAELSVHAFEIDHGFARVLQREFEPYGTRFSLTVGDFLKTRAAHAHEAPDRIIGNLPYVVANAVILALIAKGPLAPRMVFTVQREAARRMCAKPGSKDYSAFSVFCQVYCAVNSLFDIGSSAFHPVPEVVSTVVSLEPLAAPLTLLSPHLFGSVNQAVFASRRKTLRNNLAAFFAAKNLSCKPEDACDQAGLDPGCRAESLAPGQIVRLAEAVVVMGSISTGQVSEELP